MPVSGSKGKKTRLCMRGIVHYFTDSYSDLILGRNWYVRGINETDDCCYVILDTVRFYVNVDFKFQIQAVNTGQKD